MLVRRGMIFTRIQVSAPEWALRETALRFKPLFLALTVVLAAGFLPVAQAQKNVSKYYFDLWTTDNGLPQNSCNAIVQTRDGYMWIATADGLVRYDGARFIVFNQGNTPGINDNRCLRLMEDRTGALWILNQFGLTSYRDGVFHSYTAGDGLPEGIFQFFESDDGLTLISNRGIFLWRDGRSSRLDPEEGVPRGSFGYRDRSGGIWCNIGAALVCLTADGRFVRYPNPPGRPNPPERPFTWVNCMYEDSGGNLWAGTYTGLFRLVGGKILRDNLCGRSFAGPDSLYL
jgi:ligand-binding sensor domain-containing protein